MSHERLIQPPLIEETGYLKFILGRTSREDPFLLQGIKKSRIFAFVPPTQAELAPHIELPKGFFFVDEPHLLEPRCMIAAHNKKGFNDAIKKEIVVQARSSVRLSRKENPFRIWVGVPDDPEIITELTGTFNRIWCDESYREYLESLMESIEFTKENMENPDEYYVRKNIVPTESDLLELYKSQDFFKNYKPQLILREIPLDQEGKNIPYFENDIRLTSNRPDEPRSISRVYAFEIGYVPVESENVES